MAVYGTKLDTRDGRIYRTVRMPDGNWWLAENLNWLGAGLTCLHTPAADPDVYGRFYNYADGVASVISGSHMPTAAEWTALAEACGGVHDGTGYPTVGDMLKANSSLWNVHPGTDNFGFSALPAGSETPPYAYGYPPGSQAMFQSAGISGGLVGYAEVSMGGYVYVETAVYDGTVGMSVRLIVDSGNVPDTFQVYPPSGTYQGVQLVTLKSSQSLPIHYTMDGSEPTISSPLYTDPIPVYQDTQIKAAAFYGVVPSDIVTASYTITNGLLKKITSYRDRVLPYLLEQYKGDNP